MTFEQNEEREQPHEEARAFLVEETVSAKSLRLERAPDDPGRKRRPGGPRAMNQAQRWAGRNVWLPEQFGFGHELWGEVGVRLESS